MFSQTTEYALRAMTCLALEGECRVSSATLASQTQVPADYLAKVLQQLAKAELITGRRGVGGGYELARNASEISLMEIVSAVTPLQRIESCPLEIPMHTGRLCPLHRTMDQAAQAVIEILGHKSLADMISEPGYVPLCRHEPQCVRVRVGAPDEQNEADPVYSTARKAVVKNGYLNGN